MTMMTNPAAALDALAAKTFRRSYGHFIGGEWVEGAGGKTIPVHNPSTGSVIAHIQAGNAADAARAVDAAAAAFPAWSRTGAPERQAILQEMARRLKARVDDYALMETLDNGKTLYESGQFDVPAAAAMLDFYSTTPLHLHGEVHDHPGAITYVHREPIGVCAGIIPWNIPLFSMALKVGPALAAGNTIVLKPAESTCLAVLEFTREIADLLPPGVLNVLTGYGPDVGEALVTNPKVAKVAFTGSKATARKIMQYASAHLIPQTLELGGKSANVICEDADLDAAVEGAVLSTIFNKGEVCIAGTRTFVHRKLHDRFVDKFEAIIRRVSQGDPTQPTTQLGPQASQIQMDRVCAYLDLAPKEGATVLAGGKRASIAGLEGGYFIQPTILVDVKNTMRIAQEEIFGPVNCVIPFDSDEDAVRMANESPYGLGGGLWTRDLGRAHRMAREIRTGTIWVNRYFNFVPGLPLGGYKESGFGREGCLETLKHYTITKGVVINLQEGPLGIFGG
ncbi:MAG TPA: aldehyde dehydrogenase family protein [Nevskiaceae bacterium]|nr:aldehyde dehydrogenase family protein [Nevskiaceae bacterium]